ncbi:hypothetical protein ACQWU4_18240 [Chryseobacterium sp. MIQD13]|uniref:hypothetical protein n=1 Tax=Chryseobacterium sp. MIQD13 TaxID=3422310 RepID=UPI003D2E4FA7
MKNYGYVKTKLYMLLCCIYFLLSSCSGPAPASKIKDISDIKAEIDAYQSLTDENDNSVSVILYDKKGKEFGNDSVQVSVNGKKAEYKVIQSLYYSKNYNYRIDDVPQKNGSYNIHIQLSNGKKFLLSNLPSLKTSSSKNIIYNKEGFLNQDYSIQWSELHDVNVLYVTKSVKIETKEKDSNIQTFMEQNSDTVKIGPSGNYTIKKERFSKPGEMLSILGFQFTAEKTGTLNPNLLKGSSSKIRGYHEERVNFK